MSKDSDVAFFLNSLQGGGAERVFVTLANELARRGFSVDIVLMERRGPYLDHVSDEVSIIDLEAQPLLSALLPLRRYIRTTLPNTICSGLHGDSLISILAGITTTRTPRLVVASSNLPTLTEPLNHRERIIDLLLKVLYRFPDAIVVPSNDAGISFGQRYLERPCQVIPNPVSLSDIDRGRSEPQPDWWPASGRVVLAAGRLQPVKGFVTLIDAVGNLHGYGIDVELVILGEGPERDALLDRARNRGIENAVHLPGFVSNPYAPMAHADVFALSSTSEAFGNVLVEAMACGTPVVSTDCPGGPRDILNGGSYGELVPVGDPSAMADAIKRTLVDPPESEILRERAADFDIEQIADAYESVLFAD